MTVAAVVMATTGHAQRKKNKGAGVVKLDGIAPSSSAPYRSSQPWPKRLLSQMLDVLNSLTLQTCLYLAFVFIFQQLANTLRIKQEYYMDKHVMDRFIENHFDLSHNTFETVRRIADIYEWGNNVLWPGFFADMGPCNAFVGLPNTHLQKSCNDDAWPDGEGPFHMQGATPLGLEEQVRRMDQLDWTEGITVRTARVAAQQCDGTHQLGSCYPELEFGAGTTVEYGFNFTNPEMPMRQPWTHFTTKQLGANPDGIASAAIPSMRVYEVCPPRLIYYVGTLCSYRVRNTASCFLHRRPQDT